LIEKTSADLNNFRQRMDKIDDEIVRLFEQRMDVSGEIAQFKRINNLPVHNPEREQQKIQELSGNVKKGREADISALYTLLFKLSRAEQERIIKEEQD